MKHYIEPIVSMIALENADVITSSDNFESDIFFENSGLISKN